MDVTTTVLTIQGMSCDHCKRAVTQALSRLEGVMSVEVDVAGGKATVSYDPAAVSESALREAVEEAGYQVVAG